MYLTRLLLSSALALTIVLPSYGSDFNPGKDPDYSRRDEPKGRAVKKSKGLDQAEERVDAPQAQLNEPGASFEQLKTAALNGDAPAQFNLGCAYMNGSGVAKDPVTGMEWYQKAAAHGFSPAQFNLGCAYMNGSGVAKDPVTGMEWYQKAAAQGFSHAQFNLGCTYMNGLGVAKDPVTGVEWYQKAAAQGFSHAQFGLGSAYVKGLGVAKDLVKGVEWYQKAAAQGHENSVSKLKSVFVFQPISLMQSEKLSEKAEAIYDSITKIAAHAEQKIIVNRGAHGLFEGSYAMEALVDFYTPISEFGDRLCAVMRPFTKVSPGLMVSCVRVADDLIADFKQDVPTSLMILDGTVTFGASNVHSVLQFKDYLKVMGGEFKRARDALDDLIRPLYPPIAALHACQQAVFSANAELSEQPGNQEVLQRLQDAQERFRLEKEDYEEIMAINKVEIDILKGFKNQLDLVERSLPDLMPATVGARNKEFLDSAEFGYFKP